MAGKGLGGRIFRPASLGALWVLGISGNLSLYQLQRENLHNRAFGPWKCTPFGACGTTFPPEGELFPLLQNEKLKLAQGEAPLELPPPGEVPPRAGIGVHFHRAAGPVCLFSPPDRAVLRFNQNWRRRRPPPPSEPSEPCEPSEPSRPQGVSIVLNKKYLYPLKDKIE